MNTSVSTVQRRFRVFWVVLLVINAALLVSTLVPVLRGAADSYPNEHARMVLGLTTGMLICITGLVRSRARWWLIAATWVLLVPLLWLTFAR